MTKIKITILLISLCFTSFIYSNPPEKEKDNEKIILGYMDLKDPAIEFATSDINMMIMRKSRGYLWPATKIMLTKEDGKLYFTVTAIDNSWCNMFCPDETAHGFTVVNGRMFIITTKGDIPEEFYKIFIPDNEVKTKAFSKADPESKPTAKNPVWTYLHRGNDKMATVIKSVYTENLGR
ncbi:hypothetical protein GGR21_000458 [Dysgonomonas hofstadii]|uniref:Uncharacterized protein n=1 Tax=Dysgonomonas hofstadii TaxID=637886 RepID=A0A840CH76_9BACT|nr:hypothetical protein [Dysgonomonas hofstadii]MBB4034571.1 hypothetical protein [Dysgonomonas hofstadii]